MSGTLRLRGATSGYSELQAPAVAADQTFVLPTAGGTLLTTDSPISKLTLQLGSASQPSLTFEGDTDTGLYSGGTNTLNLVTGGSDRLVIDSAGNVGIGTSPSEKLHISGSNTGGFRFTNADNSNAISVFMRGGNAIANTTDDAVLSLGQRSNVSLITTGNVGIGTTSPGKLLSIQDSTAPSLALYTGSTIRAELKGTTALTTLLSYSNSPITFNIGGSAETEAVRIDGAGNVGIGASSITNLSGYAQLALEDSNGGFIDILDDGVIQARIIGSGNELTLRAANTGGEISFDTNGNTERMRIDNSGNVGIGTASAGNYLASAHQLVISDSASTGLTIATPSSSSGTIAFADGTGAADNARGLIRYGHSDNSLQFSTNATEAMRIDSSGHVGIGKTPVDTNGYTRALDLSGTTGSALYLRNATGATNYGVVGYYNSDLFFSNIVSGGNVRFYNSGSERLRIASTGQVLIGTTAASRSTVTTRLSAYASDNQWMCMDIGATQSNDTGGIYGVRSRSSSHNPIAVASAFESTTAVTCYFGGGWGGFGRSANELRFYTSAALDNAAGTTGNERMRIESDGNVAIGVNSAPRKLSIMEGAYEEKIVRISGPDQSSEYLSLGVESGVSTIQAGGVGSFSNSLAFKTASSGVESERMRIYANGNVHFGPSFPAIGGSETVRIQTKDATNKALVLRTSNSQSTSLILASFLDGDSTVCGQIVINASANTTSYSTSSDYRLKDNISALPNPILRIKQLNPCSFNFISAPDTRFDGFLAHEAQAVVPEAVTGTHNEVEVWKESDELPEGVSVGDDKLDEDGNTIPVMQGIDQSKLVPLLTAALQEAIAKIESLETRIATLENN